MSGRPDPIEPLDELRPPEHAVDVVVQADAAHSLLTILPTSHDSLSACAHMQYRMLMCKYRCGLQPTAREKQSIDLAMRRVNRDVVKAVANAEETPVPSTPDDFCVVDMEKGRSKAQSPSPSFVVPRRGKLDTAFTVVFRFPVYIILIIFIAVHDVLFDGRFRDRVRSATACELLENGDSV